MRLIPTTTGDVPANELGRVLGHEHLIGGSEGMRTQWPHLFDLDAERAACIAEVGRVRDYGVDTICDPGVLDIGRDAALSVAVTEATGVRFVLATGAYGVGFTHMTTFPLHRPVLLDCFLRDIEVGIQGSGVRAGFIKVAADAPGLPPDIEFLHRTAAKAAVATGTPIMAHSNPTHRTGLAQMELFLDEGVAPQMVQIAHCGDTDDVEHLEEVLATGCFIGMDRFGIGRGLGTPERVATIAALVERGYAGRMVLAHDSCVSMDGRTQGHRRITHPDSHLTYLFDEVLPALDEAGVPDEESERMIGANVHAWLASGGDRTSDQRIPRAVTTG